MTSLPGTAMTDLSVRSCACLKQGSWPGQTDWTWAKDTPTRVKAKIAKRLNQLSGQMPQTTDVKLIMKTLSALQIMKAPLTESQKMRRENCPVDSLGPSEQTARDGDRGA